MVIRLPDTSERNDGEMKNKLNLQLFGEGGAAGASTGAGAAGAESSGAATGVNGDSPVSQAGEDLSNVVYGKSLNQEVANPNDVKTTNDISPAERLKAFDEMVKKGGEYSDVFNKRVQDIINKRFKETKALEESLKSHEAIMNTLAAKYGVDAKDAQALEKAINDDTSMFEEAAYKEGLTPEQYRNKVQLEQENARLKEAEQTRIAEANSQQIYSQWLQDAQAVGEKFGREIDLAAECENEDFTRLLGSGVGFEAAYTAIHFDEMLNGAMAATAENVSQAMVNKIQSRGRRPAENGVQSASSKIFKSDPSQLTDADITEIENRVRRGEQISFG